MENPAGHWRRPLQDSSCTIGERKSQLGSSRPPAADGCSNTEILLQPDNENPAGRQGQPFQYFSCSTEERKSSRSPETAVPSTIVVFKSLRLRPPTPEAYGKTADFGTLCIPGSSQRRDPSAPRATAAFQGGCKGGPGGPEALQPAVNTKHETNVPELYVKPITQHPVLCAGGSSRTNGSRYPPSAHAAAFQGGFNRLHQLLHGFFTKSHVKSFQNHLP